MTKLPILAGCADDLDRAEIATPCDRTWDSLVGDARVRHCGKCGQNVYNVEAMSRDEALGLIAAREGRVCMRIFRRTDGTVVTADCWTRLREARRRGVGAFLAVLVVAGFAEVAAMTVGLFGLSNLIGRGGRTMGGFRHQMPVPPQTIDLGESLPTVPAPLPETVASGDTDRDWKMTEPKPRKKTKAHKRAPEIVHTMGRISIK